MRVPWLELIFSLSPIGTVRDGSQVQHELYERGSRIRNNTKSLEYTEPLSYVPYVPERQEADEFAKWDQPRNKFPELPNLLEVSNSVKYQLDEWVVVWKQRQRVWVSVDEWCGLHPSECHCAGGGNARYCRHTPRELGCWMNDFACDQKVALVNHRDVFQCKEGWNATVCPVVEGGAVVRARLWCRYFHCAEGALLRTDRWRIGQDEIVKCKKHGNRVHIRGRCPYDYD